jgi:hypothetical protein
LQQKVMRHQMYLVAHDQVNRKLSGYLDFAVAIAAIDGSAAARFEGHLSVFSTLRALHREHLARSRIRVAAISVAGSTISVLLGFSCLAAGGTTLRLIGIASCREVLLFLGSKRESIATIGTLDRFVLISH